jgi:four helix bundle protein
MENDSKQTKSNGYEIHERIYRLVVRIIKLINSIPKNDANQVIINQLIRSATSIGANDQEADGCNTKRDFVHCYTVVRKELKETHFWLRLVSDTNSGLKPKMKLLLQENQELILIVSAIINKARIKSLT